MRTKLLESTTTTSNTVAQRPAAPEAPRIARLKLTSTLRALDKDPALDDRDSVSRVIQMLVKRDTTLIELRGQGEKLPGGGIATGKEPAHNGWPESRKVSRATVRDWLAQGRNYGVLPSTGAMCVLDIESAGRDHFNIKGLPDDVLVVDTPGGGWHVYLELRVAEDILGPLLKKLRLMKDGVLLAEIIARKGYVVGAGSTALSKKSQTSRPYVVRREGEPLKDRAIMTALLRPFTEQAEQEREDRPMPIRTTTPGRVALDAATKKIREASRGERHDTFIKAGSDVFALVNAKHIADSDADEALRDAYLAVMPDKGSDLERCMRDARAYGFARVATARERAGAESADNRWYAASELPVATPDDDIVRNLIGSGEIACLAGPSGSSKSFLALELAVSIAGNRPAFLGMRVQRHGPVLYLAGEGVSGLQTRIRAADPSGTSAANLRILRHVPQLTRKGVAAFLKSALQDINTSLAGQKPVLLIVDTTAYGLAGVEENSNSHMAEFVSNVRRIASALDCAVLLIHHVPKKKEPGSSFLRGASALPAALDVILVLRKVPDSPNQRTLSTEKQRDRASSAVWSIVIETAKVGDMETMRVGKSSRITESGSAQLGLQKTALRKSTDEEDLVCALAGLSPAGAKVAEILSSLRQSKGTQWKQKKVRVVLGRCEEKGWLKREGAARSTHYKLLPEGEAVVAKLASNREP